MKTFKSILFLIIILAAFTCTNNNKKVEESTGINKSITEKFNIKKSEKIAIINSVSCKYIIKKILTTSPRYIELTDGLTDAIIKNGGQSFGILLEGSPNPRQDKAMSYSGTYDYTLYETYPDRQLNTSRFSFNPDNKQLYEYDAIHDQLLPIEFDKNLLIQFDLNCKCYVKISSPIMIKPKSD